MAGVAHALRQRTLWKRRSGLIHDQITRTLEQFPDVHQLSIAIGWQTGAALEP
jgi:hypothetical protein